MIAQPAARFPEPLLVIRPTPVATFSTPSRIVDDGNTLLPASNGFANHPGRVSLIARVAQSPGRIFRCQRVPYQAPQGPGHDLDQSASLFREPFVPSTSCVS